MADIFDKKGMMIIPAPEEMNIVPQDKLVAVELYCPNGHNLITTRAMFGENKGVLLWVRQGEHEGTIAFSPICNDLSRVIIDIDLEVGKPVELFCPECGEKLPTHSKCTCGGDLIAYFRTPECNFSEALGICNIVRCPNAHIIENDQLTAIARHEAIYFQPGIS